jgi:hypothetical protein
MENLTLDQIRGLAQQTQSPSISIFLPTHRAGQETQQDPIRFRNLLREAEVRLLDSGLGPRAVDTVLEPARALLAEAYFWQHQSDGLAVFVAPGDFHTYRLPFGVEERLVIARAYYVQPVLPLFTANGHYYILVLSQDEVRLFEGTRHSIGQIDLPRGSPASLEDALRPDTLEKQSQFHSADSQGAGRGGARSTVFHGQGPGDEEGKERIGRYLNLVDTGLKEVLREARAPLILAGVAYLLPMYRQISEYAHLMPAGITGAPEHLRPDELQARAWPIVEPYFRQELEQVMAQFRQLAGTDKATDNLEATIAAAFHGRVDRLIVAVDTAVWGQFDPDTGQVVHYQAESGRPDDLALVDFAAMQTLHHGGRVYTLPQSEMPTNSPVSAILRY